MNKPIHSGNKHLPYHTAQSKTKPTTKQTFYNITNNQLTLPKTNLLIYEPELINPSKTRQSTNNDQPINPLHHATTDPSMTLSTHQSTNQLTYLQSNYPATGQSSSQSMNLPMYPLLKCYMEMCRYPSTYLPNIQPTNPPWNLNEHIHLPRTNLHNLSTHWTINEYTFLSIHQIILWVSLTWVLSQTLGSF